MALTFSRSCISILARRYHYWGSSEPLVMSCTCCIYCASFIEPAPLILGSVPVVEYRAQPEPSHHAEEGSAGLLLQGRSVYVHIYDTCTHTCMITCRRGRSRLQLPCGGGPLMGSDYGEKPRGILREAMLQDFVFSPTLQGRSSCI